MARERLNKMQKEIIRVYQRAHKQRIHERFDLSRQKISKLLFRTPDLKRPGWRSPFRKREEEIDKTYRERRLLHEVETEKQAWERMSKDQQKLTGDLTIIEKVYPPGGKSTD